MQENREIISAYKIIDINPDRIKSENRTTTLVSLMAFCYMLTCETKEEFEALYTLACGDHCGGWTWEVMQKYKDCTFDTTEDKTKKRRAKAVIKINAAKHWFNNGKINVLAKECPAGFTEGILRAQNLKRDKHGRYVKGA